MKIMMNQVLKGKIKVIWMGSLCVFLLHPGLVFSQSIPPQGSRSPVPVETEAERLQRTERAERGREARGERLTDEAAITAYVSGGRVPTGPASLSRPTPENIRPSFEPVRHARQPALPSGTQLPPETRRVEPSLYEVRGQLIRNSEESIAIKTLRARIQAERSPEFKNLLEAELQRLLESSK